MLKPVQFSKKSWKKCQNNFYPIKAAETVGRCASVLLNQEILAMGRARDQRPKPVFPHLGSRTWILGFRPESRQKELSTQCNGQVDLAVPSCLNKQQRRQGHEPRSSACRRCLQTACGWCRRKWNRTQAVDSKITCCPFHMLLLELFLILKAHLECCLFCETFPSPSC